MKKKEKPAEMYFKARLTDYLYHDFLITQNRTSHIQGHLAY